MFNLSENDIRFIPNNMFFIHRLYAKRIILHRYLNVNSIFIKETKTRI